MLTSERLKTIAQIAGPVLSLYWNLPRITKAPNNKPSEAWIWLKSAGNQLIHELSPSEGEACREQLRRAHELLRERRRPPVSMVLFLGRGILQTIDLEVPLKNQVRWGPPDLFQLLAVVSENKPYGVVVVDRSGAWIFRYQSGELKQLEVIPFRVSVVGWKRKDLGHVVREGIKTRHGSQRDAFRHRIEAHYDRFCRAVAKRLQTWQRIEDFAATFLLGAPRITVQVSAAMPAESDPVVRIDVDHGHSSMNQIRTKFIAPQIARWQKEADSAFCLALVGGGKEVITGLDEVLTRLQKNRCGPGKIHQVVVSDDLDVSVKQCVRCGWVDASADPVCPVCQGRRSVVRLQCVLPQVLVNGGVNFSVLTGNAATTLHEVDGIAALLGLESKSAAVQEVSAA